MYLQGVITIDPSQLTHLDRVKPTKGFARLGYLLTGGLGATQEERETFCAVTILQQINVVMRSLGIDNMVRLSKDELIIFEDNDGEEGDLQRALDTFSKSAKPDQVRQFDTLELLLEHHSADLTYLIDIRINRTHRVGEHPIQITVNGLPRELVGDVGKEYDRGPLKSIFSSQQSYDDFIDRHEQHFSEFLDEVDAAFRKHMKIDDVCVTSRVKIIRPSRRINEPADVPVSSRDDSDPLYQNHYGFGEAFFFAWIWSDFCHAHDIQCHDFTLVDSSGSDVMAVGSEGFQAGVGNTMNVEEPFSPPSNFDVQMLDGSEYVTEAATDTKFFSGDGGSVGWLSSLGDAFGDSFGGNDGGSACGGSSCGSSCGGGCGGCGGG